MKHLFKITKVFNFSLEYFEGLRVDVKFNPKEVLQLYTLGFNPCTLPQFNLLPSFLQDYYWTFCAQLWKDKEINETNILAEAHAGATSYVKNLRRTGVLQPEPEQ